MQNTYLATALFTMLLVASGCGDTGPETSAERAKPSTSSVGGEDESSPPVQSTVTPVNEASEEDLQSAAAEDEGHFNINITGDVELVLESHGDLRCIGMGDSGPGYLQLRNGHRTEKISFHLPLDAETGAHQIISWSQLTADRQIGKGYSIKISMPLKGFHMSLDAEGTLKLTTVGKQPGERMAGSFEVTSDSAGTSSIQLEGVFDFRVAEGAREDC